MPRYAHLRLARLPERLPRRKRPGFGGAPARDIGVHGAKLQRELGTAIDVQVAQRRPEFIDPKLILSVSMATALLEKDWETLGLRVLSSDSDRTLVLCASQGDVEALRARLNAYSGGPVGASRSAPYTGFVANIESISTVSPTDRIGRSLRAAGFVEPEDFQADQRYLLDIELWDVGVSALRTRRLNEIQALIHGYEGEEVCRYVGPSVSMLRFRGSGDLVRQVLLVSEVASVDLPPKADSETATLVELGLGDLPELMPDDEDAPLIGVIDSGISAHPLLRDIVVGQIGVPAALGTADEWGHGTAVSGVAVFGDLRGQLVAGELSRSARICGAKVTNDRGDFDDRELVPAQMRNAIQALREQHGCRIFVCALADRNRVYTGGKVGAWAATLDELARELDVVIVVAAGNRYPRSGANLEEAVTDYPGYLLEANNRFFEPAGAVNVITVGSLSHGSGINEELAEYIYVRPITLELEPSPFTRVGPGVGGAIKPDLVDLGGTMVFDPATLSLRGGKELASAGVLTLHHRYLDRLLTSGSGTSYAAPMVANKAAKILAVLPQASANLIRALLVGSASVPREATERLAIEGEDATTSICGFGRVDTERAGYSADARVTLYAEDALQLDHFAVYHIPVPTEFQTHRGRRTLTVTLAYDPPVRHTRNDYCGVGMNFRLLRGCTPDLIFEHYKWRAREEVIPEIADRFNCKLLPGPQERERGSIQRASVTFSRNVAEYGDDYYLVIRCESGWVEEGQQRFAVVVELEHEAEIQLYQQIRQRVRVRA